MSPPSREQRGQEAIDRFLHRQGRVQFQMFWLCFTIGQIGAFFEAVKLSPDRHTELARMLDQAERDVTDFERDAAALAVQSRQILEQARGRLAEVAPT